MLVLFYVALCIIFVPNESRIVLLCISMLYLRCHYNVINHFSDITNENPCMMCVNHKGVFHSELN